MAVKTMDEPSSELKLSMEGLNRGVVQKSIVHPVANSKTLFQSPFG